jgi:hypothetical protein
MALEWRRARQRQAANASRRIAPLSISCSRAAHRHGVVAALRGVASRHAHGGMAASGSM